jgi:hypothetical protein
MKNKIVSIKNHVVCHRFKYGVAVGLSAGLYLTYRCGQQYAEFLKEHNLYDEFHAIGMEV